MNLLLELRFMDFGAIGEAMGMAKAIENANKIAQSWVDWSTRQVAIAKAESEATEAGRLEQIRVLRDALEAAAPDHELLRETGLVHASGRPEVAWQREFYAAYDHVAIANQLPTSARPKAPWEQARQAVLREPVECRRILFVRTWWWRGEQHRSEAGANRAREAAANKAAAAVR
jgi:hypothetical protein